MRPTRLVPAFLLLSSFFFLTRQLTAQSVYGGVWGRLTASAGTPVAEALVTVTAVQTGASAVTKTDAGGFFTISNLAPDYYYLDVQAKGFTRVHDTIPVNAGGTNEADAILKPGDPSGASGTTVTSVTALKLDRTDVSTLFDSRDVDELPLVNLNLTQLLPLVPGAVFGALFIPPNQNPQRGRPVDVNGQHFSGGAFQLDGAENRDPLEGIIVINPTLDSVKEMNVTTQGYNAEFGQATAGVVTVQTKSGSNGWHGDAFGYRRSGWGQADNPFAPAGVPPLKYEIFGGSLGGPIVKNKLFLFGDYQGTRSSMGANVLLSVPPANVRKTCLGSKADPTSPCDLQDYSKFIIPEKKTPLVSGTIPNGLVSDQAVAILTLLPHPNNTPADSTCAPTGMEEAVCNNYLASGQEVFNADQFDVRTDYNASSALRFFGRYSFGNYYDNGTPAFGSAAGGVGATPSGFDGITQTRNQGLSTGLTYSLSPKLLTDFRFGYFRYRLNISAPDYGQIPPIDMPEIFAPATHDPFATGMPDFQIPGQQGQGQPGLSPGGSYLRIGYSANYCHCPLREREQQFQLVNNWTRTSGQHIVKWGVDLRFLQNYRLGSDQPSSQPRTGHFTFAPDATGLGLATFLLGDVTAFERTSGSSSVADAGEHQKRFGFYGQDTWRLNSRLTLNYGLRWEIYFPQTVTGAGGFLLPNLSDQNPADAVFNTPTTTNPAGGVSGRLTNFAPRLGIAYQIHPQSVIRVGYGRSFDAGYAGDIFGIAPTQNPPVTVNQIVDQQFNLAVGPPNLVFRSSPFSLLELATKNMGDPHQTPLLPASKFPVYALPARVRVPTVDSWNLTFQHEFTSHLYFELAYVGNKGTHVFTDSQSGTYYDLSQPSLQNIILQTIDNYMKVADPSNCKEGAFFDVVGNNNKIQKQFCLTVPDIRSFYERLEFQPDTCLPEKKCYFNPTSYEVRYFGNNANDNYNSLQAKVQKSFNRGYSFLAHYTWSKGLDYDANYFAVNPRVGYGPDSFDIRHRFVMTNIWELPIGRGKAWLGGIKPAADRLVGGWTISAVTAWQSGRPFTPTYSDSACAKDSDSGDPCRPNRVGAVHISGNRTQYFTTTGGQPLQGTDCTTNIPIYCGVDANGRPISGTPIGPWARPGAGQIGNAGRNSLTGPGFFQSDIGLAKVVHIKDRTSLQFRVDAFNAFNKVNLGQPNSCVDCGVGVAGAIDTLGDFAIQRLLQFLLRIEF